MHADQLHIDTELAAALIGARFPDYRGCPVVRMDGAGTVNAIFRVGEHVTARLPLQPHDPLEAEARMRREAASMNELAQNVPVPAPRALGIGSPDLGYPMPWSLQSWIAGDVATPDALSASSAFAEDVAGLIAALRAVDRKRQAAPVCSTVCFGGIWQAVIGDGCHVLCLRLCVRIEVSI